MLTTSGLIVLGFLAYQLLYYPNVTKKKIPGPSSFPLFGAIPWLVYNMDNRFDWISEMFAKYDGGPWILRGGIFPDRIMLNSAPDIEHMLKTNFDNYIKGPDSRDRLYELLGVGIFTSDGPEWRAQRKIASHMFSARTLRESMSPVFLRHACKFQRVIADASEYYVNIQDLYFQFTLDSIGEIAFGYDVDSLGKAADAVPFAAAFDQANEVADFRFINPLWKLGKVVLPIEAMGRQSIATINAFAADVIRHKRQATADDGVQHSDILSRFMQLRDEHGQPFDDTYLRDVVMLFIIAGRDTTASALTWITYLLAKHPDVQTRVRAEIGSDTPSFESVKSLRYLQCVIDETLRLYPPVPFDMKRAVQADQLPSGMRVKANDYVAYPPWGINRNPNVWDDPLEFRPQRWERSTKPTAFEYPTFNAGPRICLGQTMAYLEMKLLLAMLLQKNEITLRPDQPIQYHTRITLSVKNGLYVHLEPL